jgi:hypothetical protein
MPMHAWINTDTCTTVGQEASIEELVKAMLFQMHPNLQPHADSLETCRKFECTKGKTGKFGPDTQFHFIAPVMLNNGSHMLALFGAMGCVAVLTKFIWSCVHMV